MESETPFEDIVGIWVLHLVEISSFSETSDKNNIVP